MHDRPAKFLDNHDGDNVTMLLDQDFDDMKKIEIRLANVWAPEMDEEGGEQVRDRVRFLMIGANSYSTWPFVVHTHKTKKGKNVKSFDRYVATVMMPDGESLNSKIMAYIVREGYTQGIGRAGIAKDAT